MRHGACSYAKPTAPVHSLRQAGAHPTSSSAVEHTHTGEATITSLQPSYTQAGAHLASSSAFTSRLAASSDCGQREHRSGQVHESSQHQHCPGVDRCITCQWACKPSMVCSRLPGQLPHQQCPTLLPGAFHAPSQSLHPPPSRHAASPVRPRCLAAPSVRRAPWLSAAVIRVQQGTMTWAPCKRMHACECGTAPQQPGHILQTVCPLDKRSSLPAP